MTSAGKESHFRGRLSSYILLGWISHWLYRCISVNASLSVSERDFQAWHQNTSERAGFLINYSSLFQIKCRGRKKKSHEFWWSATGSEMNCAWDCECVSCWFTHTSLRLALAVACLALICYVSAPVPPSLSLMSIWLTDAVSELSGAPPLTTSCWRLGFSFSPIHLPPPQEPPYRST